MSNTFGRLFRLTTFGESHGPALGGVVDGCPPGIALAEHMIQAELDKRRPGQGGLAATPRNEPDRVRLLSGIFEGRSTGAPIGFIIENTNQHSGDYAALAEVYRPGHGDYTYDVKYGLRDYRGGGRSSGRETVSRVAGGAIALAVLAEAGIKLRAFTLELGGIAVTPDDPAGAADRAFFAPCDAAAPLWENAVRKAREAGDTLGGIVQVEAHGVPAGLGEPVFDKLDATIAQALMSVGAVKAVEIGDGFAAARSNGSQNNDLQTAQGFLSNRSGGILAGISTGAPIVVRAAVKPIASIARPQAMLNTHGGVTEMSIGGRHDCAAIPRVVPVLKAMLALALADALLIQRAREHSRNGHGEPA